MASPLERLQQSLAGRYRVDRELGAGGMATVYLASDLRHDRDVALKVLRPELAAVLGADRFLAEIKTTARLQHPNILPLFDSGVADGLVYYVMPFVEGSTLRHRLDRESQLSLEEALRIATAVAGALDYAHAKGVIHRDIKPDNILFEGGQPIVADFGIALAVQQAGGNRLTETGLSLGTPGYMSPEQATGGKVDGRSDIYALACVTYEMLAGEPPHRGATAQATIAKVVTERPAPVSSHRDTVPPQVDAAVAKALAKIPADRFATASEFAAALSNPAFGGLAAGSAPISGPRRFQLLVTVGLAVLAAAVGWLARDWRAGAGHPEPVAAEFSLPAGYVPAYGLAISPNGRTVVVQANLADTTRLLRRHLDRFETEPIPGSEGANAAVAFSPDGQWIAFAAGNEILKVAANGPNRPTRIGAAPFWSDMLTWAANDTLYGSGLGGGIWSMAVADGGVRRVTVPDSARNEVAHVRPMPRRNGELIFGVETTDGIRIAGTTPDRSQWSYLPSSFAGWPLALVRSDLLLAGQDGIVAARLSDDGTIRGEPVMLHEGGGRWYAVSPSGNAMAFVPAHRRRLVWVDRAGTTQPISLEPAQYRWPRLSPDGTRLAMGRPPQSSTQRLEVVDLETSRRARLTTLSAGEPVWSPDGGRVAFWMGGRAAGFLQIYSAPSDGSGSPAMMFSTPADANPTSWSSDGSTLLLAIIKEDYDVTTAGLDGTLRVLAGGKGHQRSARFSPNGNWVAYSSDESGRNEVYLIDYPAAQRRIPVSIAGGTEPVWSRDGRELFFRSGRQMIAVAIGPGAAVGTPRVLFEGDFYTDPFGDQSYDVGPDGRFLMLQSEVTGSATVRIIANWRSELDRRLPR